MAYNSTPNFPNNLYSNGNVHLDSRQLANQLFQEQLLRQRQQARQTYEIDLNMRQQMGKSRSADTPAIAQAYSLWKKKQQELDNDRSLHHDGARFAKAQNEVAGLLQDVMTLTTQSQEEKANHQSLVAARAQHPDLYDDNFAEMSNLRQNTPVTNLGKVNYKGTQINLGSDEPFLYKGTNTDFSAIDKGAAGEKSERYWDKKPLDATGIQTEVTGYKSGNSAPQRYESYMGAFYKHGAGRDAGLALDLLPKGEFERVENDFMNIPADVLKKKGMDRVIPLDYDPNNKVSKFAAYKAMKGFLEDAPEVMKPITQTNEGKKREVELADKKSLAQFEHKLREGEITLRSTLKGQGKAEQESSMDTWMKGIETDAKKGTPYHFNLKDGTSVKVYDIPISPAFAKSFEKVNKYGRKVQPNRLGVDDNGNYYPQFFKAKPFSTNDKGQLEFAGYEMLGKNNVLDEELTSGKPFSRDALKPEIASVLLSPKLVADNMDDEDAAPPATGMTASPAEPSAPAEHADLSQDEKDWKQEGQYYRYKDGRLFDAQGKIVTTKNKKK